MKRTLYCVCCPLANCLSFSQVKARKVIFYELCRRIQASIATTVGASQATVQGQVQSVLARVAVEIEQHWGSLTQFQKKLPEQKPSVYEQEVLGWGPCDTMKAGNPCKFKRKTD